MFTRILSDRLRRQLATKRIECRSREARVCAHGVCEKDDYTAIRVGQREMEIEKSRGVVDTRGPRHTGGLHAYKGWRRDALIGISRVDSKLAAPGIVHSTSNTLPTIVNHVKRKRSYSFDSQGNIHLDTSSTLLL